MKRTISMPLVWPALPVSRCREQSGSIRKYRRLITLIMAIAVIAAGCKDDPASSDEENKPVSFEANFQTAFTFLAPPPMIELQITGNGTATLLGTTVFNSLSTVNGTVVPNIQIGSMELTGANGDKATGSFEGEATPPDANGNVTFSGNYTITGGTGSFNGASGSGTYSGSANIGIGTGQLTFTGTVTLP